MSRDRPPDRGRPRTTRTAPEPLASYHDRPTSVIFGSLLVAGGFFIGVVLSRLVRAPAALRSSLDPVDPTLDAEFLNAVLVNLAVVEVGFPLVAVGFLYARGNRLRDLGLGFPTGRDAVGIVGGTLGLLAVNGAVLAATGAIGGDGLPLAASVDRTTVVLSIAAVMFLVVAPAEELLFRGVIQRYLVGPFGRGGAVATTAAMFAVAHLLNASMSAFPRVVLLVDLLAGLALGAVYEYTDNLLSPVAVHGAYNTALFSLMLA